MIRTTAMRNLLSFWFLLLMGNVLCLVQPSMAQTNNAVQSQEGVRVEVTLLFQMRKFEILNDIHSVLFENVAMNFLTPLLKPEEPFVEVQESRITSQTLHHELVGNSVRQKQDTLLFVQLQITSELHGLFSSRALAQGLLGIFAQDLEEFSDLLSQNDLIIGDILSVNLTEYSLIPNNAQDHTNAPSLLVSQQERMNPLSPTASPTLTYPSSSLPSDPTTLGQPPSTYPTFLSSKSRNPTVYPTLSPSVYPSLSSPVVSTAVSPNSAPSDPIMPFSPTAKPSSTHRTATPTLVVSLQPTMQPSTYPSFIPTIPASLYPTMSPSEYPSLHSIAPSLTTYPSSALPNPAPLGPNISPSAYPTLTPLPHVSLHPSVSTSAYPSLTPTIPVSLLPTISPSTNPTVTPLAPTISPSTYPSLPSSNKPSVSLTTITPSTSTNKPTQQHTLLSSPPSFTSSSSVPQKDTSVVENLSSSPSLVPVHGEVPTQSESFDINPYFHPTRQPSSTMISTDPVIEGMYQTYETRLRLQLQGMTFHIQGKDIRMFENVVQSFVSDYMPPFIHIVEVTLEDQVLSNFPRRHLRRIPESRQLQDPTITSLNVQFTVRGQNNNRHVEEEFMFSDMVLRSFRTNYNDFLERLKFSSPVFHGLQEYEKLTVQPGTFPTVSLVIVAMIVLSIFMLSSGCYLNWRARRKFTDDNMSMSTLSSSSSSESITSSRHGVSSMKLPSTWDDKSLDTVSLNHDRYSLTRSTNNPVSAAAVPNRKTLSDDRYSQEAENCEDSVTANSTFNEGRNDRYDPLVPDRLVDISACIASYVQKRYK